MIKLNTHELFIDLIASTVLILLTTAVSLFMSWIILPNLTITAYPFLLKFIVFSLFFYFIQSEALIKQLKMESNNQ